VTEVGNINKTKEKQIMPDTPNYNESEIAGQSWQRAVRVVIENPYKGLPYITFVEEKVYNIGEKTITEPVANLGIGMNPEIPSHLEIYSILNELYVQLRDVRDNPVVIVPTEPVPPPAIEPPPEVIPPIEPPVEP
jgi:hypothetical protein